MKLILLGPPGSGKGTIAEQLEKEFSWFHLSAGAVLREEVEKRTSLGKEIKKYIDNGKLVPDKLVTEIVKIELHDKKHFILDGFPRTVAQAEVIKELTIDKVLFLDIPKKKILKRFSGRRKCPNGHGYHVKYLPPKKKSICDIDGLRLSRRADDAPKVVKERFKIYEKLTAPVVKYYQKKKKLVEVNGEGSPEEVYKKVKAVLEIY